MTEQPLSPDITDDDKLWAALGYPIFFIIPIIALLMEDKKDRPFIKYHSVQALIFQVIAFLIMFCVTLTLIGTLCVPLLWLVSLWPAYEAYQGNYLEIPGITQFARNQDWI